MLGKAHGGDAFSLLAQTLALSSPTLTGSTKGPNQENAGPNGLFENKLF